MRVHNVIITTTGSDENGISESLDRLIRKILELRKTPILVVGPEGDSVLLFSKLAERCELIFDPNFEGQTFSSVKAGLHATTGPAFVLPLKETTLSDTWENPLLWETLEKELDQTESQIADVLRPAGPTLTHEGETSHHCFPQVVTPKGVKTLLSLEAQTDWMTSDRVQARVVNI